MGFVLVVVREGIGGTVEAGDLRVLVSSSAGEQANEANSAGAGLHHGHLHLPE